MSAALASNCVLLVDDEKTILDVLTLGFKKAGVETKRVESVEDAIVLLEMQGFAAVVTDKNFPGKSGLELIKYISEKHPHTARLVITGFANTESVLEAIRSGADDYLIKPFESIALVVERVKAAIAHRRTQVERAALAESLREMQRSLRKTESTAFQKMTELELLQNVLELRLEDATSALREKVATLESELASERDRRASLQKTLLALAESADDQLKRRLLAEAEILG
jgi:DNA-binding NtrC family response regulator